MLTLLRQHKTFAVLLATIVLMELTHGIEIVSLLPLYLTRHFGENEAFVGLVASVYLFVDTLVTRTPAGWLADRWGRKPTLALGILLSLVPLPLMALANDPNSFIPLNVVNGLGAGMIWPPIYALVADSYGREQRGTLLGLVNMVMLGGLVAGGPIAGSALLYMLGYPDPSAFARGYLACSALVLLALALVILFVRESSTPRAALEKAVAPLRAARLRAGFSLRVGTLPSPTFGLLLLIGLTITLALGLIVPILTLFGTDVLKVDLKTFAFIMIPPALTAAIALVPAGRWADRRGRHAPMLLGLALIAIPLWSASASTQPIIVSVGGMVAALGYALLVPAWNALIMDYIPAQRRGLFLGGIATVQGLGLAAGPRLGGELFQLNPYAPFWSAGALLSLGALIAALLMRQQQSRRARALEFTDPQVIESING
jgi:MFS family permease